MEDNMRALRWTKVLLSLSGMSGGDGAVLALWLGAGTALLALCLAEVVVRDTFASRLETLFLLAGCAHIYSKQVNLALKRGGVGRLVAALEAAHTRTLPQPPPLARADRAAVNMILCSGAAMSFVFLATFGVTLSSYCFLSLEEPKLPYPFWVPFDPRQSYLLAYACQLVMVPTYVSYFTFFSLLITVTMYISGQLTFLARGLRNLPSANPHNSEIKEALVYYIRIHNDVIR
ncbi:hypothetical protein AAG570_010739 [Ranatra chinensis]|uniref:Uncharacterized protein n=1 Tax=Ranatra chinensis TaxID=642074 RepID=A0ABD0Z1G4_9HEMI